MRVLIVEDNAFSRKLLVKTLEKAGYQPVVAEDGAQAMVVMQLSDAPSMVLLDWMMPGLSGIEVCEQIRKLDKPVPPYIIMLTAKADRDDVAQGFRMGSDDYIKKPFDSAELIARLNVGKRLVYQQSLMHTLIDALPDPIYVKDSRGLYLGCNDAYAEFAGVEKDHIGQKQATDVLPNGAAQKSHMDDLRALAADEPMEIEEWSVDANGRNSYHYSVRIPLIESSSGLRGLLVLQRNLSQESMSEKLLRYEHKMAVLGGMLCRVSHKMKNILGAMMGFSSLGLEELGPTNEASEYLQDIYNGGESGKKLLDQLLQFSHQESHEMELVSLGNIVESSLELLRMLATESVQFEVKTDPDVAQMYGEKVQLQQMIVNLAINAFYAMGSCLDPCLQIEVTNELDPSEEQLFVIFRMKDNGVGILDEVKEKIFDLHYTTHEEDGSGLGLSIIKTIIDHHQGTIDVESEEGVGTCFTISFPAKV